MNLKGGVVITNPIPKKYQLDYDAIMGTIETAVKEAENLGIKGKKSTPFLLEKIATLTDGKSLDANIKLVLNNAALAAKIACSYTKLTSKQPI